MDIDGLYRVQREDLPRLEEILNECFAADPLYCTLIPDPDVRRRLMPELFRCDMDEFFATCEVYADSPALHGLLVVSEEGERSLHHFYLAHARAMLMTDAYLIKEDVSLHTLHNFIKGEDYLNSSWTRELTGRRLHIIYLAVDPSLQHHGIAATLMDAALSLADRRGMSVSLETHNEHNLPLYRHFGFEVYQVREYNFPLKQYCLVRPAAAVEANALSC